MSRTDAVSRPVGRTARREDIQGLRAFSVLAVMAYHAEVPGFAGGFVGVDVFFVISGFVIGTLLLRELAERGSIDLARFFTRRVRRLLPPVALLLAVLVVPTALLLNPAGSLRSASSTAIAAAIFGANFFLASQDGYFASDADLNPFLHTWSLSVEEQFYLLLPFLLLLAWRLLRRCDTRRRLLGIAALVALATSGSFLAGALATFSVGPFVLLGPPRSFYLMPLRAWEFGVGVLLAALGASGVRVPSEATARTLRRLGIAAIAAAVFLIDAADPFPGMIALVPVLGAGAVMLAGTLQPDGTDAGLLSRRWLLAVGDRSYSLYLWHWPPIVFLHVLTQGLAGPASRALAVLISALPAMLAYRFVETPLRHDERFAGRRVVALAAVCVVIPVAIHGALLVGAQRTGLGVGAPAGVEADMRELCQRTSVAGSDVCVVTLEGDRPLVMLVGDSHAESLLHGVAAATAASGLDLIMSTQGGCAYNTEFIASVERSGVADARYRERCSSYVTQAVGLVRTLRPSVVVIAHRGNRPLLGNDPREAQVYTWSAGLAQELAQLDADGIGAVVVLPVPEFPVGKPTFLSVLRPTSVTRTLVVEERDRYADIAAAMTQIVASSRNAVTVDPFVAFCDRSECSSMIDGSHGYSDGHHLSRIGALELAPALQRAIAEAALLVESSGARALAASRTQELSDRRDG
jgi:peptidoglycan/LPS O-acetylase OafA/YrhL